MADDYRLSRHVQIWDQQNKTMKRVAVAGLVFASFMLVNILRPYSADFEESRVKRDSIVETERIMQRTNESLRRVRDFEKVISETRATVDRAPWQSHKDELIETYARMRFDERASAAEYQRLADRTVKRVAADAREVMMSLQNAIKADPRLRTDIPSIDVKADEAVESIGKWERGTLGTRWYGTIREKDQRLRRLETSVENELQSVSKQVMKSIDKLSAEIEEAEEHFSAEVDRLEQEAEQKSVDLEELEKKMQSVLPVWIRGLVGVEDMVQLFPFIVLGIALFLLYEATKLTSNYKWIAARRKWSSQEQNDPMYSSPWTLIYRGRLGTATTVGLFVIVFVLSWVFAGKGGDILLDWIDAGHEPMLSRSSYETLLYATDVLLILALFVMLFKTLKGIYPRQKQHPE